MNTFRSIDVTNVPDFLSGKEYSGFVEEEIEVMRRKYFAVIRVKVSDVLVEEMEAFDSLAIHLKFDFIENLVGFVPPVHAVTKTY